MSYSVLVGRATTARELRKKVPIEVRPGVSGFTTEPDGIEDLTYRVEIDMAEVEALARKAGRNRTGKSSAGPVRVTITQRKKRGTA